MITYSKLDTFSSINGVWMLGKCIKLYTCIGGLHTVLHSKTAGQLTWRTQNAPKFLAAEASPGPHTGEAHSAPATPQQVVRGGGGKPLSKNAGALALAQPFGLRVRFAPTMTMTVIQSFNASHEQQSPSCAHNTCKLQLVLPPGELDCNKLNQHDG